MPALTASMLSLIQFPVTACHGMDNISAHRHAPKKQEPLTRAQKGAGWGARHSYIMKLPEKRVNQSTPTMLQAIGRASV